MMLILFVGRPEHNDIIFFVEILCLDFLGLGRYRVCSVVTPLFAQNHDTPSWICRKMGFSWICRNLRLKRLSTDNILELIKFINMIDLFVIFLIFFILGTAFQDHILLLLRTSQFLKDLLVTQFIICKQGFHFHLTSAASSIIGFVHRCFIQAVACTSCIRRRTMLAGLPVCVFPISLVLV